MWGCAIWWQNITLFNVQRPWSGCRGPTPSQFSFFSFCSIWFWLGSMLLCFFFFLNNCFYAFSIVCLYSFIQYWVMISLFLLLEKVQFVLLNNVPYTSCKLFYFWWSTLLAYPVNESWCLHICDWHFMEHGILKAKRIAPKSKYSLCILHYVK